MAAMLALDQLANTDVDGQTGVQRIARPHDRNFALSPTLFLAAIFYSTSVVALALTQIRFKNDIRRISESRCAGRIADFNETIIFVSVTLNLESTVNWSISFSCRSWCDNFNKANLCFSHNFF